MKQRPCLYLVEDNLDIRRVFALILSSRGFEVIEFTTAQETLDAVSKRVPDVALIDIGLPDMNGWELASQMRGLPGTDRTVLAALTGRDGVESRQRSDGAGFHLHFVKPIEIGDVSERLFAELKKSGHQYAA